MEPTPEIVKGCRTMLGNVNDNLIERLQHAQMVLLSILAGTNVFFLGPPGGAKTYMADMFKRSISGVKFNHKQFTQTTTLEDIFGALRLSLLDNDQFERKLVGKLADSHIFLADEMWKAVNILQTMLEAINEKRFAVDRPCAHGCTETKEYRPTTEMIFAALDAGKPVPRSHIVPGFVSDYCANNPEAEDVCRDGWFVDYIDTPLWTVIATSNEMPADESLDAMFDRFPVKMISPWIENKANFGKFLRLKQGSLRGKAAQITKILNLGQIETAQDEVRNMPVSDAVIDQIEDLWETFRSEGLEFSDRRWEKGLQIVKAHAWFNGRSEPTKADLIVYKFVLWNHPEQIEKAAELVEDAVSSKLRTECVAIYDEIMADWNDFSAAFRRGDSGADNYTATQRTVSYKARLQDEVAPRTKEMEANGDTADREEMIDLFKAVQHIVKNGVNELLGIDATEPTEVEL